MKHARVLQGQGISMTIGKGDSDEDIVVRIKTDAPVLRPDDPVPADPVLSAFRVRKKIAPKVSWGAGS